MITFRNLYEDELEKWFKFLNEEIFLNEEKDYFRNQWYCDPLKDISGIFVAVDCEGCILSTLRVFIRDIYINGVPVSCGGIGSVGTKEEHRGQKLSTTLFEMSKKHMEDRGICVSYLLCGDHNEGYYSRCGYGKSPWSYKISTVDKHSNCSFGYDLINVNFDSDVSALASIHQQFSGNFNGSIVRSTEYWKQWVPFHVKDNCKLVLDGTGKAIAYINIHVGGNYIYLLDFGSLPEHSNIFDSLIKKISSDISVDNLKVIYPMNVTSNMKVERYWESCLIMYNLITPFSLGNLKVGSTEKLLEVLKGHGPISKLLLWMVDDV